jgi:hypothetical protein
MFAVGPEGRQVPLCLDCYIRFAEVNQRQIESCEREINYLTSQMEALVGLPGIHPRYPERPRFIQTGAVNLNNFNISNSQIGALNTGTIQNVDATVTVLKSGGDTALAVALTELAQAVMSSNDIAAAAKNQILELLNELAQQGVAPKDKRKPSVTRAVLAELGSIIGGIASLVALWEKFKSVLESVLGA